MPEVLDWQGAVNPRFLVHRAAQALAEGRLVAFPTETVYGIAVSPFAFDAVERLALSKGRPGDKPMALAITGPEQALEWLPDMGTLGRRLARRCWPGPVTLVSGEGLESGLARNLPVSVRRRLCPGGTLGLRAPAHDAIQLVMEAMPGPLVLTSANRGGEPESVTADEVIRAVGNEVDLVIADGPSPLRTPSTVIRVEGNAWSVLREGALPISTLERLATCLIVFVCTGNTCRSPLAEALFKRQLANHLGCTLV
jgi:protein-tyrosine phosphatase